MKWGMSYSLTNPWQIGSEMIGFGRFLVLLAVMMLVAAGGQFGHADEFPHSHPTHSHSHTGGHDDGHSGDGDVQSPVHCGGFILNVEYRSQTEPHFENWRHRHIRGEAVAYRSRALDPPPPRKLSLFH